MAKKTAKKTPPSKRTPPSGAATQKELRRVGREIVKALERWATLAEQVGRARLEAGEPLFVAAEEDAIVGEAASWAKGPLPEAAIRSVFRSLLSGSRSLVRELRIAHLGPFFSYSHLAAMHRFGQSVAFVPVGTIAAVFEEIDRGTADFGLVPIENSTDGRVSDTLDMLTRSPSRICGEVELPIHHALLAMCPRADIREVYSKPQALSQCRNWLAKHLPTARSVEVTSTSTAAQLAREKPGAAAIASLQAGIHYGLNILAERIEDNPGNTTRFSVIGKQPAARTGNDKTAMLFQLDDRAGTLAEALNIFKRNRVNLTWIESFPIPGKERAYLFFVEMEGHESDLRVRRATASIEKKALRVEILGSFPVSPSAE